MKWIALLLTLAVLLPVAVQAQGTLTVSNGSVTLAAGGRLHTTLDLTVTGTLYAADGTVVFNGNGPTGDNVAGLGFEITTAANLGSTEIIRAHAAQMGNGNEGILRYYDVTPTNNAGLDATLVFHYDESELNGLAEDNLVLVRSADGGANWTAEGGTASASNNMVTLGGIDAFSRWTLGSIQVPISNHPPTVDAGGPYTIVEGGSVTVAAMGEDSDDDPLTYAWDLDDDGSFETDGQSPTFSAAMLGGPATLTIKVQVSDGFETATAAATVKVQNVAPVLDALTAMAEPVPVGTEVEASAPFTDAGTLDEHTAQWDWGDGSMTDGTVTEADGSGSVTDTHTYTEAGVYTITLMVTDDEGTDTEIFQFVVVFDPDGGFVTGGGWIDSPEGAYPADPTLTGKANFGFVSKYKKGQSTPTGQTEFQFKAGDLNFHSTSYDWLVIAGTHQVSFDATGLASGVYLYRIQAGRFTKVQRMVLAK